MSNKIYMLVLFEKYSDKSTAFLRKVIQRRLILLVVICCIYYLTGVEYTCIKGG